MDYFNLLLTINQFQFSIQKKHDLFLYEFKYGGNLFFTDFHKRQWKLYSVEYLTFIIVFYVMSTLMAYTCIHTYIYKKKCCQSRQHFNMNDIYVYMSIGSVLSIGHFVDRSILAWSIRLSFCWFLLFVVIWEKQIKMADSVLHQRI